MKQLIVLCAILFALASQAQASTLESMEGKVIFSKGDYHLVNATQSRELSGLSNQQLRHYEGLTIKAAGQLNDESLEIYKVFVKTEQGYETTYDWDVVNQDLYAD
ncbi:MAG: hypothetical protein ACJA1U_001576 [Bermanella sp.]|jgi:hypothetical protein